MSVDFTIVGAGVSGLTAALVIKDSQPDAKVTIIDAAPVPGGLLKSVEFHKRDVPLFFDYGTHIPQLMADDAMNQLVFPEDVTGKWHRLDRLEVGNFFNQQLNLNSQFVNVSTEHPKFCQILQELLETLPMEDWEDKSLEDFLIHRYGQTLTDEVFQPLILKMTGAALCDLTPQTPQFYGLGRVAIGSQLLSENLKKIPQLDQALAYTEDQPNLRAATWVYPGEKGVGEWIAFMVDKCQKAGVEFLFNHKIQSIKQCENEYQLSLSSQDVIHSSKLIWTLPFYVGFEGAQNTRFDSRSIAIYHFTCESPALVKQHYIYCQDAAMESYRITLYDNLYPKPKDGPYKVTVEVICDEQAPNEALIRAELQQMGIFADKEKLEHIGTTSIPYGFPVPLLARQAHQLEIYDKVKKENPGVIFAGRGHQGVFFTVDVLNHVYQTLKAIPKRNQT